MLGEIPPLKDTNITHGICKECEKKMMGEIKSMEQKK
jgi:hypothetical protein